MAKNKFTIDDLYEFEVIIGKNNTECLSFESYIVREWESGKKCGRKDGIDSCVAFLEQEASKLFINDKDKEAVLIRELIKRMKELKNQT